MYYIYESWLPIVNHTYSPHAVFADKEGNPIYKGDHIAYKGQIYEVLEAPVFGEKMGNSNRDWMTRSLYDGKTMRISEMITDDGGLYLTKLKQSIYKDLAERD